MDDGIQMYLLSDFFGGADCNASHYIVTLQI
jgi:hypothetical protein